MKTRHISISRLMDFMRCPRAYLENILRARDKQASEPEVLGDVTHMLTAGKETAEAREYIEVKLPEVAAERKQEVLQQATVLAEKATDMSGPEVTDEDREVQLKWQDPETGYIIYAKPDELIYFEEQRNGKTLNVMQITDVKSQAEEVKSYHWRQLFLFGLIAALAENYHYAIKLVVRLATPGIEEVKWFASREMYRQLEKLRATLREIDQAWATKTFPEKAGGYCKDCPLLANCRAGQLEMARRETFRQQMEEESGVGGRVRLPVLNSTTQAVA